MQVLEKKSLEIKMESFNPENGIVKGYAAVFGNEDSYGDIILPGAFKETIKNKKPKFLLQHDSTRVIGFISYTEEKEKGLFFEGQIQKDEIKDGAEAYALLKSGALDSFSIGYNTEDYFIKDDKRYLTKINLGEISIVTFPANTEAKVTELKSEENELIKVAAIDSIVNEAELKTFLNVEEIPNDYKLNETVIYTLENNELKVCFNAIKNLSEEVIEENKSKIQLFFKAFRKEFNNYSLMSSVCEKKDIIPTWDLNEFDKYLKNSCGLKNSLTNNELKIYNKTIAELKAQKNNVEEIDICKDTTSEEKLNLEDLISVYY